MNAPARPGTEDRYGRPGGPPPLTLSGVEFEACWELLRLGDPPLTLELPSPGRTRGERRRVVAGALTALARRGLAAGAGPAEAVVTPLRLLADAEHQLELGLDTPAGPLTAILAVTRGWGVRVVGTGDGLILSPLRPAELVAATVGLLAPSAGVGRPVNLPAEVFDAAAAATTDGKLWTMADELARRGVPRRDAASWVRMCTGIRGVGRLGAATRRDGLLRPGPWAIGVQRTETGDFLQLRRPDQGGDPPRDTVTVGPLGPARLAALTTELLSATRRG